MPANDGPLSLPTPGFRLKGVEGLNAIWPKGIAPVLFVAHGPL